MSDLFLFLIGFAVTCIVGGGLTVLIVANNREMDRLESTGDGALRGDSQS